MKKSTKGIIIGIIAVIGAVVLALAMLGRRFHAETSRMTPHPTGTVVDGVYAVRDAYVNIYLVRKGDSYIVVDGGNDRANIEKALAKAGIDPLKASAVFLTHSDTDHVAAVSLFKNAKVYISKPEEQMVNGGRRRMFLFHNRALPGHATLEDGETVRAGGLSVRGILTPGHTPGSMCYLVEGKYLFTGDTLSLKNGAVQPFNSLFNMDDAAETVSIKKLAALAGVGYVCTAHYGCTGDFAGAFAPWR